MSIYDLALIQSFLRRFGIFSHPEERESEEDEELLHQILSVAGLQDSPCQTEYLSEKNCSM